MDDFFNFTGAMTIAAIIVFSIASVFIDAGSYILPAAKWECASLDNYGYCDKYIKVEKKI